MKVLGTIGAAVIALLLTLPGALGAVERAEINDRIQQDRTVREEITMFLRDNAEAEFSLRLPAGAHDIILNNERLESTELVKIPLACQDCRFTVSYSLAEAVRIEGDDLIFQRTLSTPGPVGETQYRVFLPLGVILRPIGGEPSAVPTPQSIETDGERIIITWRPQSAEPVRYFLSLAMTEAIDRPTISDELQEREVWLLMGLSLLLGAGAGLGAGLYVRTRFKEEALPFVPPELLSPDEKAVVGAFAGEPIWQKEITTKLQWSKSKTSGVLSSLERKGIVGRERYGRTHKVTLLKTVETD